MSIQQEMQEFFRAYGESFKDGIKLSEFYGDCAMASTPSFVGCLKGSGEVRAALENVAKGQVRTGMRSLAPLKVEVTNIDPMHWWARVYWGAKFEKTGDQAIEFDISYLVRKNSDRFVILLYVAHQDEQVMRQKFGLT